MIRHLFKDTLIYSLPTIINQGISIFLLPLYTRVLLPADYGVLDLILVFGSFINLTIALEIFQGVARLFPEQNSDSDRVSLASSALWFTLAVYTIFSLFTWFTSDSLALKLLGSADYAYEFRLGLIMITVHGIFLFLHNHFRWELKSGHYSGASVLTMLLAVALSIYFALYLKMLLAGVILARIVSEVIGIIYCLKYLQGSFRFCFDIHKLKEMLKFSAPLVPSSLSVMVSLYADRLMINHFLNLEELGVYSLGFRLTSALGIIMTGFQRALTPLIYKHHAEEATPSSIACILQLFIALVAFAVLILGLFAREILMLFTTSVYYSAGSIVVILAPAVVLSQMYIFAPGIDIAKKTGYNVAINFLGCVANIILNLLFIPVWGIAGAAVSKLASNALSFFLSMKISQKLYYVPHSWRRLLLTCIVLAALLITGLCLNLFAGIAMRFLLLSVFLLVLYGQGYVNVAKNLYKSTSSN